MPWFENESDLNDPQGKILCRAYGMIEIKNGVFDQIKFKPWPRIITNLEINSWGHRIHVFGKRKDHCVLYYNQPFFHKNFLALKYIVSNRGTSFASFQLAQKILDLVAKIKCTDALVCEINNERITRRLLERWGWEEHRLDTSGRHFIKRFYGNFPDHFPEEKPFPSTDSKATENSLGL